MSHYDIPSDWIFSYSETSDDDDDGGTLGCISSASRFFVTKSPIASRSGTMRARAVISATNTEHIYTWGERHSFLPIIHCSSSVSEQASKLRPWVCKLVWLNHRQTHRHTDNQPASQASRTSRFSSVHDRTFLGNIRIVADPLISRAWEK